MTSTGLYLRAVLAYTAVMTSSSLVTILRRGVGDGPDLFLVAFFTLTLAAVVVGGRVQERAERESYSPWEEGRTW